jgi:putative ABC transport system permease protein
MGADLTIIGSGENQFMPEGKIPEEYVHQIAGISIVDSAYPELFETGLVQGQTCLVMGVNPSAESHVTVVEGSYLDGEYLFEVVVGSKLRDRLGLSLGDMVTVSSASSNEDFKVVGVYQAMSMLMDEACIVPLKTAQQIFGDNGKASIILVNVKDVEEVDLAKAEIGRMLNGIQIIEQKEVLNTVQNGVTILKTFLLLVASISLLVAGLGIMNTMFMSVMERKREVGILKSIGTSKTQIMRIFLIESALLGAIGGFLGCVFGVGISKLAEVFATKYFAFPITTQTSVEVLAFGLLFAIMASVISGLYPCLRAASLRPVEALRIE